MSIFPHPTTQKQPIPSASEAKALSVAHRHLSGGDAGVARKTLFSAFGPADAERHFAEILHQTVSKPQRVNTPAPLPPIQQPTQISPALNLVRLGLMAFLILSVFNMLSRR